MKESCNSVPKYFEIKVIGVPVELETEMQELLRNVQKITYRSSPGSPFGGPIEEWFDKSVTGHAT